MNSMLTAPAMSLLQEMWTALGGDAGSIADIEI
jgi:hypothetical protein